MPTWLAENPVGAYFVCAALGLAFGAGLLTTRRPKYLAGVAVALLLALGVFVIDMAIETDREQIERKLTELASAAQKGDISRLSDFFDPGFRSDQFGTRDRLLKEAEKYLRPGEQRSISIWAPEIQFQGKQRLTCICQYSASGLFGGKELPPRLGKLELVYVKGGDGQWRIEAFHLLTMQGERRPIPR